MSTQTSTAATAAAPTGGAPSAWRRFISSPLAGPVVALVLAAAFFSFQSDRFLTGSNFALILGQVMVVATIAVGQTLIILTAGIDLSCGAIMAFGAIVMTKMAVDHGINAYLTIAMGIGVCALFGLVNGLLVTRINLPPFIVTLGMLSIATAMTLIYSEGASINGLPDLMRFLGKTFTVFGTEVRYGIVLTLVLYALCAYLLSRTAYGKHVYAVGSNPEGARLSGIPVKRVLLSVYVLAGVLYGIAALLLVARTGVGDPKAATGEYNLDSITAVVLGGTSLFGGRGLVIGTLVGAVIVGVFRNGLQLMQIDSMYQTLVTGVLVILAVAVDQFSRRKARS
jgi:fructose transport system permease protein